MNLNGFESINELKKKIENLENKNRNILMFNNNLSNENKNNLFTIKEKEKEIIKLKNEKKEKDLVIKKLEKKNYKYKKQLIKLLQIINQNNIKININISPSINYNNNISNNFSLKYDCEFLLDQNNNTLKISKEEILCRRIIDFSFKIINTGIENWPLDTILKCNPDESNIYFFYLKYNSDEVWENKENDKIIKVFPVRILFKNYKKINEKNILNCFLVSDREGKIGNKFGSMKLIVENL